MAPIPQENYGAGQDDMVQSMIDCHRSGGRGRSKPADQTQVLSTLLKKAFRKSCLKFVCVFGRFNTATPQFLFVNAPSAMGLFSWVFGSSSESSQKERKVAENTQTASPPTVSVGGFAIAVPEGLREEEGYIYMNHGQKYTLRLKNTLSRRCDAQTFVDGQQVGTWRIDSNSFIDVERPIHRKKHFTFYAIGTPEAEAADIEEEEETGLIKVVFKPEKIEESDAMEDTVVRFQRQGKPGGTGLSGQSAQRFQKAESIDYDESEIVEVNARLITEDTPEDPEPLGPKSNDVPPPV